MKLQSNIKVILYLFFIITASLTLKSQTVTDYDGNVYQTVTIGNQIWMAENLRTTHYSDGIPLIDGTGIGTIEWGDTSKRYFYYNDNQVNAETYGCLYSWFAAVNGIYGNSTNPSGIQGVCPTDWHIPSISEWSELIDFVGQNSAIKLLEGGTTGFDAVYGGLRDDTDFQLIDYSGFYVTSDQTESGGIFGPIILILFERNNSEVNNQGHSQYAGYSIRCVKDSNISNNNNFNKIKDLNIYPMPCSDFFYIDSQGITINQIDIYSLDSKLIKIIQPQGNYKISVSEIDKGLYIIKVYIDNIVYSDKLIIK